MDNLVKHGNSGDDTAGIDTQFFVSGRPVPQGSLKFIKGRAIHVRAQDLAVWRALIALEARKANVHKIEGAVEIGLTFIYNRPKTVKREYMTVTPDLDKLIRAVLDGLTDVAYIDDSQVIKISASKQYGAVQGVIINIRDKELSRNLFQSEQVEINDYSD